MAEGSAPTGAYSSVPSYPAPVAVLSCISRRSAMLSHHGGWKCCHTKARTHSIATYIVTRTVHRLTPTAISKVNGMLRHSIHRQGNCIKRSLGRTSHSGPVIASISTAHAAAHATSEYQSVRLRLPQLRALQAAKKVSRISATAIQEMTRLKASCSASAVRTKRKLSMGREPPETASAMFTHFCSY